MGIRDVTRECVVRYFNTASEEDDFTVAPYSFEPEDAEGEDSSNSRTDADFSPHIKIP